MLSTERHADDDTLRAADAWANYARRYHRIPDDSPLPSLCAAVAFALRVVAAGASWVADEIEGGGR
jgi:hypothetical protein